MKNKKGGIVVAVLLVVIVAITVWAFVWVFEKDSEMPVDQSTSQNTAEKQPEQVVSNADMPVSNSNESIENWQSYRDGKYGFEFSYPRDWKHPENENFFLASPEINVLQLDFKKVASSMKIDTFVANSIQENDCKNEDDPMESDHIIKKTDTGIYYVEYCTATSEDYHYSIKLTDTLVLDFSYRDDFDPEWTEDQKITTLKKIVTTLKINR